MRWTAIIAALSIASTAFSCQFFLDASEPKRALADAAVAAEASADVAASDAPLPVPDSAIPGVDDLVGNLSSPTSLVVDATYVYWLEPTNGIVARCPITGCNTPEVLADKQPTPFGMTMHANTLVWTTVDDGASRRLTDTGVVAWCGAPGASWIASSNGSIYVAFKLNDAAGSIQAFTFDQCIGGTLLQSYEPARPEQLRATVPGIAWIMSGTMLHACSAGSCSAAGGLRNVVTDSLGIATFASDADSFYVARAGAPGGIYSLPIGTTDGVGAVMLVPDLTGVSSLAVDSGTLFIAERTAGRIRSMSTLGGSLHDVATIEGGQPTNLVVRGGYVYFIDRKTIRRVRVPS